MHVLTNLVPRPRSLQVGSGAWRPAGAAGTVSIYAADAAVPASVLLRSLLWSGLRLHGREVATAATADIRLVLDDAFADGALESEAYQLTVDETGVLITASGAAGFVAAVHTLLQLCGDDVWRSGAALPRTLSIPYVCIDDAPRYSWRGLMIDVARHFLPLRELRRIIELMAMHKLNTLHLHLTDDQGWRLEVLAFPRLTEVGSWRASTQVGGDDATAGEYKRPHGGFYTQDELRDLVAFAADHGVTIVPEIDVPGHSQAAIAAYPQLGISTSPGFPPAVWPRFGVSDFPLNMEQGTVEFFRTVLDELLDIFPSRVIGLGGDECPSGPWEADPRSVELAAERELSHPRELQAWFLSQLAAHLDAHGRTLLAWDDLLEHESRPDALVLGWRGEAGVRAALRAGLEVIACPDHLVYLDYRQSEDPREPVPVGVVVTAADIARFDPMPTGVEEGARALIRGGQGNLWAEHLDNPRSVDYMLWPRACALAEALWAGPVDDDAEFAARLHSHLGRLDAFGVEYRQADGPKPWQARPGVRGREQTLEERAAAVAELTEAFGTVEVG
ncbi:beta-N-acetylhexosaminidase [Leifsonia sp. A12D58]|uniref:beta-N-acetylhexosaminidase n=1 Tax=Leifsonia sp. A12D58 TaxID=3397674 RepID=UPI0039E0E423